MYTFNTVHMIKERIIAMNKSLKGVVKPKDIRLFYKGVEIKSGKLMNDYNLQGRQDAPTVLRYSKFHNERSTSKSR